MSYTFELSLSVLNHLGRNLYRSFVTVIGEAVSNAWDADASSVWIDVDHDQNRFSVRDDGHGMKGEDFQGKFLRVGYSKRRDAGGRSPGGRPYIGRKGIGKLALLSCADVITVASRAEGAQWIGGVIENKGLDEAITEDLSPGEYKLKALGDEFVSELDGALASGTSIQFVGAQTRVAPVLNTFKRTVALYFRFSLLDDSFNIYVNGEPITVEHLRPLAERTEFLWRVGESSDPFVDDCLTFLKESGQAVIVDGATGFIASVSKPRDLSVIGAGERVGIDLFVNGRLRERSILRHIPTARIAESYLYGQIHLNQMDDEEVDRFTSSREGVVAGDPLFEGLKSGLKAAIEGVIKEWDSWRRKHRKDGDPEDDSITKKARKSGELFNVVTEEFIPSSRAARGDEVVRWISDLSEDAEFNFASYAECYLSENLLRRYFRSGSEGLPEGVVERATKYRAQERASMKRGRLAIGIRQYCDDLSYLDMDTLAKLVDGRGGEGPRVGEDAVVYKPMRDALMHTARLSAEAKTRLTAVYDNIKARVALLLFGELE